MYFKIKKQITLNLFTTAKNNRKNILEMETQRDGTGTQIRGNPKRRGREFGFRSRDWRNRNPEGRKGTGTQNRHRDAARNKPTHSKKLNFKAIALLFNPLLPK